MNSFALISKDAQKRKEYIQGFAEEKNINPFDQTIVETTESSLGIEAIRLMQKTFFLKPFKGENKLVVIEQAQLLTIEAQNALLKILEEPPLTTYLFLSAATENSFLPTILSRCKLIKLTETNRKLSEEQMCQYTGILVLLQSGSTTNKLALAETVAAKKDELNIWFEECILFLRDKMLENPQENGEVAMILERLQEAYKLSQTTNVNTRLLLEHTFLELT